MGVGEVEKKGGQCLAAENSLFFRPRRSVILNTIRRVFRQSISFEILSDM